jgi:glutathione S-transferase
MSLSPWPSLATIVALLVYSYTIIAVGQARFKYSISPPAMTGNPDFERVVRVQANTLEHLIVFLPALWLFSLYLNPVWGGGLGLAWCVGRILYAWGYMQEAKKRAPGFAISFLSSTALLGGAAVGIIRSFL